MAIDERDPHTGHKTTGHEWNGIKELNTPVPKVIWFFLILTVLFAILCWILLPAWPLGVTYTKGLLGVDQQKRVARTLRQGEMTRADWSQRIDALDFAQIQQDKALMTIVRETGRTLFGDNCSVCHGRGARGGPGYPDLADRAWLWGGDAADVAETIRAGINAPHEETRISQMMAFGQDQMLDRAAVLEVIAYIQSLSGPRSVSGPAADTGAGQDIFSENCAACHGEDGRGSTDMGAPDLTDGVWLYGGDRQSLFTTIWRGRQGQMPAWEGRLTPVERKILTLYVLDLGSGREE